MIKYGQTEMQPIKIYPLKSFFFLIIRSSGESRKIRILI